MKQDLECVNCAVHYTVKWTPMESDLVDPAHPLEDNDYDLQEELFPSQCPFCGSSADEASRHE